MLDLPIRARASGCLLITEKVDPGRERRTPAHARGEGLPSCRCRRLLVLPALRCSPPAGSTCRRRTGWQSGRRARFEQSGVLIFAASLLDRDRANTSAPRKIYHERQILDHRSPLFHRSSRSRIAAGAREAFQLLGNPRPRVPEQANEHDHVDGARAKGTIPRSEPRRSPRPCGARLWRILILVGCDLELSLLLYASINLTRPARRIAEPVPAARSFRIQRGMGRIFLAATSLSSPQPLHYSSRTRSLAFCSIPGDSAHRSTWSISFVAGSGLHTQLLHALRHARPRS